MATDCRDGIVARVTSTYPATDVRSTLVQKARTSPPISVGQIVRVVADGTGRSPQEVWVLLAGTLAVTVSRAAAHGFMRLLDYAAESDAAPAPARRARISAAR